MAAPTEEFRDIAAETRGETGSQWMNAIVHGKPVDSAERPDFAERQWRNAIAAQTGVGDRV